MASEAHKMKFPKQIKNHHFFQKNVLHMSVISTSIKSIGTLFIIFLPSFVKFPYRECNQIHKRTDDTSPNIKGYTLTFNICRIVSIFNFPLQPYYSRGWIRSYSTTHV